MTSTWTLAVARNDLARTTLVEGTAPELAAGEARLRVDRVGMTANNVTYAVLGDSFHYWDFFPATAAGLAPEWGLAPLWGSPRSWNPLWMVLRRATGCTGTCRPPDTSW